jgi:hypothetical protein
MYLSINSPEFDTFHGFSLQPYSLSLTYSSWFAHLPGPRPNCGNNCHNSTRTHSSVSIKISIPHKLYKRLNDRFCALSTLCQVRQCATRRWLADSVVYTQPDRCYHNRRRTRPPKCQVWIYSPVVHATLEGRLQLLQIGDPHRELQKSLDEVIRRMSAMAVLLYDPSPVGRNNTH